jgi:hypothetical protein
MAKKKNDNDVSKLTKTMNKFHATRILAIAGVFVFAYYYLLIIFTDAELKLGTVDWGIDQGYSGLVIGILLVIYSIYLIAYPFQQRYRSDNLDRVHKFSILFPIGFALYLVFFWHFVAHLPMFNFYHSDDPLISAFGDKVIHFLFAFILTLLAVQWKPSKITIVLVFLLATSFELFELAFIVNFSGLYEINYEIIPFLDLLIGEISALFQVLVPVTEIQQQLIHELIDVVPDTIANTLGILVGWFFVRKQIRKAEEKEKRLHKRKGKKK